MDPHQYDKIKYSGNAGFSALFVVIILGGAALAMALWFATTSVWSAKESRYSKSGNQARILAESCAEIALENIRENKTNSGNGTQSFAGGTCDWAITSLGQNLRRIVAQGRVDDTIFNVSIETKNFNPVEITSWQEN